MSKLSPFIALLRAELVDRGHLLLVGAASGVLALLMPLLPGLKGLDAGEVHTIAAWILAALIGSVVAIGLGATLVGSDLSEGRIGYYLSLPLSPAAVWWAKLIAASATTIGSAVRIPVPISERWARIDTVPSGAMATKRSGSKGSGSCAVMRRTAPFALPARTTE